MAVGDWGSGTRLIPVMVNVTVDESRSVNHVGIGYHLWLPSGKMHQSAYTWAVPADTYQRLQAVIDELLSAAAEHEGVSL
jgi:hypothetical protein